MGRAGLAQNRVVLGTTLLLFLAPALCDLLCDTRLRPFGWVAADTFYYLTVARNIAHHGSIAYDRVHASNGFHPLWQLVTAAAAMFTDRSLVLLVVLMGLALLCAALVLIARAWQRPDGSLTLLLPLLPVGVYAMLVSPLWLRSLPKLGVQNEHEGPMPLYGTLWSYANGMESSLVIFFLALALWLYVKGRHRESPRAAIAYGLALAGIVLSRLDHGLLVLPILAGLAVAALASRERRLPMLSALASFALPLIVYLAFNKGFVGTWLPTSGTGKSTVPAFSNDVSGACKALLEHPGTGRFLAKGYRISQILVPVLGAAAYLAVSVVVRPERGGLVTFVRPWLGPCGRFTAQLAPGVILLALYNLLFVPLLHQGHWYFPVSTLFLSLAALSLLAPLEQHVVQSVRNAETRWLVSAGWIAVAAALVLACFVKLHRQPRYHAVYAQFYWYEAPAIRTHYGGKLPRFLEYDDGIIAWSLDSPTMSSGLGLDPKGWEAVQERKLLGLALDRGFDRLASLVYFRSSLRRDSTSQQAQDYAKSIAGGGDLSQFEFSVDYVSESLPFSIVRARRK